MWVANKDVNGFPIVGTMRLIEGPNCDCNLVTLPTTDMTVGVGETQYYHPGKFRFFVRKDCEGCLIPNSLFSSYNHPGGNVIEFKKIVTN